MRWVGLELETALSGHRDYRRFCMVGIARSGSTLLLDLLNAPGNALAFGELFRSEAEIGWDVSRFARGDPAPMTALFRTDPVAFLERHVFRRWPRRMRAVGFKIFYYHAARPPFCAVWDYLTGERDVRIVHVTRHNVLRQYLSLQIAFQTGVWSASSGSRAQPSAPMFLDLEDCVRHFNYVRDAEQACSARFARHEVLEIRYENLGTDLEGETARLQRFLGLPQQPVRPTLVRQQTRPLSDMIANYAELERSLAGTRWAVYLDD